MGGCCALHLQSAAPRTEMPPNPKEPFDATATRPPRDMRPFAPASDRRGLRRDLGAELVCEEKLSWDKEAGGVAAHQVAGLRREWAQQPIQGSRAKVPRQGRALRREGLRLVFCALNQMSA